MRDALTVKHRTYLLVLVAALLVGCASSRNAASAAASPSGPASASPAAAAAPTATSSGPAFLGTHYPSQGHTHLMSGEPDDFVYNSDPPTSGPHREIFNDTFVSSTPLASFVQVHLLEHGNVLLQYNCLCPDVASALANIAMEYDRGLVPSGQPKPTATDVQAAEEQGKAVIVAPYPHMKSRIAVTAWTHLGALKTVDAQKIESFINAHLSNPAD
jgi:hypothetical protein